MPDRQTARVVKDAQQNLRVAGALNGDAASFSKSASLMVGLDTGARNFAIPSGKGTLSDCLPGVEFNMTAGAL